LLERQWRLVRNNCPFRRLENRLFRLLHPHGNARCVGSVLHEKPSLMTFSDGFSHVFSPRQVHVHFVFVSLEVVLICVAQQVVRTAFLVGLLCELPLRRWHC